MYQHKMTDLFSPISIPEYIKLHIKNNPSEDPADLKQRLRSALDYALSGKKCACGNPIWVIGAAHAGYSCFSCITGEAVPDNDYEIGGHLSYLCTSPSRS